MRGDAVEGERRESARLVEMEEEEGVGFFRFDEDEAVAGRDTDDGGVVIVDKEGEVYASKISSVTRPTIPTSFLNAWPRGIPAPANRTKASNVT